MTTQVISVNVPNVLTIMLIALAAVALSNFAQHKTGKSIPYLQ